MGTKTIYEISPVSPEAQKTYPLHPSIIVILAHILQHFLEKSFDLKACDDTTLLSDRPLVAMNFRPESIAASRDFGPNVPKFDSNFWNRAFHDLTFDAEASVMRWLNRRFQDVPNRCHPLLL